MKIKKIVVLGTALAAGCLGNSALADMVSYSDIFGPETTPFSQNLTYTKFNTQLGTLTGISIVLNTSEVADVDVINLSGSPLAYTDATAAVPITVTALAGLTTSIMGTAGPISGTAAPGLNMNSGVMGTQNSTLSVASADFGAYEANGFGNYDLTVAGAQGMYGGSGPFDLFFGGSATASGTIQIIYDYTPSAVPDTAVSLSLAGGVIGLIAFSRKLRTVNV